MSFTKLLVAEVSWLGIKGAWQQQGTRLRVLYNFLKPAAVDYCAADVCRQCQSLLLSSNMQSMSIVAVQMAYFSWINVGPLMVR